MWTRDQKLEEANDGQVEVEDKDLLKNEIDHLMNLIIMPILELASCSSKTKSIIPVISQEDLFIEIPFLTSSLKMNDRWLKFADEQCKYSSWSI